MDTSSYKTPIDKSALLLAALTALVHLVTVSDGANPYVVIGACVIWIGFVIYRFQTNSASLQEWGFRKNGLAEATKYPAIAGSIAAISFAGYALWKGHFSFPAHTVFLLLLYPVWGVIQQFLVLGVVVGNLEKLSLFHQRKWLLIIIGAVIFGSVHLPALTLTAGTTLLALFYVPHFLRYRNIWPLGILHGWLGSLFYLWVLNRDPWLEVFG